MNHTVGEAEKTQPFFHFYRQSDRKQGIFQGAACCTESMLQGNGAKAASLNLTVFNEPAVLLRLL